MGQRFRSANKTVYSAKYHIIWCPKYRRRVLVDGVDVRLKQIIGEVAGEVYSGRYSLSPQGLRWQRVETSSRQAGRGNANPEPGLGQPRQHEPARNPTASAVGGCQTW